MKRVILWSTGIVLLLVSIGLAGYPFFSNYLNSLNSKSEVINYLDTVGKSSDKFDEIKLNAIEYNKNLISDNVVVNDPFSNDNIDTNEYENQLVIDGTSVISNIEIPAININLPVYHGTDDDVLNKGIGHLSSSSLPVGGIGSHTVLTGHTGVASNKLFTDLDKLVIGDVFFINTLGDKMAYKVDNIAVVTPTDTDLLQIDHNKDYATLVTCTPFGVNSHRLLVRGVRISYDEAEVIVNSIENDDSTWNEEYFSALILGVSVMFGILLIYALIRLVIYIFRKRKNDEK